MSAGVAVRRFAPDAIEVSAARRFLRDTLHAWGLPACDDAELVVSELVSNAIRHGAGPPLVRLERRSDRIRVEVHDEDSRPPVAAQPGPREVSGRGLRIVEVVALAWGHTSAPTGGKTVWADIALP